MGWGARKDAASCGTLTALWGSLMEAAAKAGNLPSATPTRGASDAGTALRSDPTMRASLPYISSRPSSPT